MNEHFVASRFYHFDDLTWCVQSGQPIPIWLNFFILSRDYRVWIICFFTFAVFTFLLYFLEQFEHIKPKWHSFRIAIGILSRFIGMPYTFKPTNSSSRILFAFGILGCIIFSSCFMSILITSMNKQFYAHQVQTINEIVDLEYDLAGDYFSLQQLEKRNEVSFWSSEKSPNYIIE